MNVLVLNGALVRQEAPLIQPLSLGLGSDGLLGTSGLQHKVVQLIHIPTQTATHSLKARIYFYCCRVIVCYSGRR